MASRTVGSFIRPLRRLTQGKSNWTARWKENENVPSGWGHQKHGVVEKISGFFYNKLQQTGTKFSPNSKTQQKLQESGHSFLKNNSQAKQPEEVA